MRVFTLREKREIARLTRNITDCYEQIQALREAINEYEERLYDVFFGSDYDENCELNVIDAVTLSYTKNSWEDQEEINVNELDAE